MFENNDITIIFIKYHYQNWFSRMDVSRYITCQREVARPLKLDTQETFKIFTVTCLVAWPLNESEAGVDLVLIETSQLFS